MSASRSQSTPPPRPPPPPHQKAVGNKGVDPAVLKQFSRRTRTGLPNWAVGACLVGFVGGAYVYTMQAVKGKPGGAKEELEEAILQEMQAQAQAKK